MQPFDEKKPNKDRYTIGELAALYGIGADTIRYYEEKGLIVPVRGENGYRYYGLETIWRMNVIRNLRTLGFSVSHIGEYLDSRTVESTKALLWEELRSIDEKLGELLTLKETVREQLSIIESSAVITADTVRELTLPPRRAYEIKKTYTSDEDMDLLMKALVEQNGGKIFIIGNNRLASVIDETSDVPRFKSAMLFDPNGDVVLPGGKYLSVCYRGRWNSHQYLRILFDYAQEHHLRLVPPFMDLVWVDVHTSADETEHVSEVQALAMEEQQ